MINQNINIPRKLFTESSQILYSVMYNSSIGVTPRGHIMGNCIIDAKLSVEKEKNMINPNTNTPRKLSTERFPKAIKYRTVYCTIQLLVSHQEAIYWAIAL